MLRLLPLMVFVLPAAWATWLVGRWLREGLAALLYYRLADLTPWIIAHHDTIAWTALALAAVANLILLAEVEMHRVRVGLIAFLSITAGVLWMSAALVQPGWWLAPTNGLLMFTLINTPMVTAGLSNLTMVNDDIAYVLGRIMLALAAIALFYALTVYVLP
jgi:hypothetical protein